MDGADLRRGDGTERRQRRRGADGGAAGTAGLWVLLDVQRQVVGARETALAQFTLERLGAGVLPVVTRQFVGAREPPLAARPRALVRLLAYNNNKSIDVLSQQINCR